MLSGNNTLIDIIEKELISIITCSAWDEKWKAKLENYFTSGLKTHLTLNRLIQQRTLNAVAMLPQKPKNLSPIIIIL
jgi:hypothetical protein